MTNLPTMCVPTPRKLLKLYLATKNEAMGALIAQEDQKGAEQPIYYDSQILKDAKTHYLRAEKACHSLVYAAQRLWHFFFGSYSLPHDEISPYTFTFAVSRSFWKASTMALAIV